ncbi:PspA/IM30 family protein [Phycisphaerales bacterium AB-hyl4]|uniref:PspA/IM30 family protein n=1 Tax=Natronomicrosphaera hydrolytica TaxID=3242702 RepID=A0ABV4U9T5_9BACT
MKEGITARVGRIISGGFNQLIDSMENAAPEMVMEEAIREVDGAIDEVRAELGKTVANKHLATRRLSDANGRHEKLAEQIDLAVEQGREELAEAAIAQQLDLEAQVPVLETTINDCAGEEKELEGYIAALQAKKREMKEELREFRKSRAEAAKTTGVATGSDGQSRPGSDVESRVSKAGSAFDRVLERQTGLGGLDTSLKQSGQLAELEDLSRKHRIEERLAAAKARAKKS